MWQTDFIYCTPEGLLKVILGYSTNMFAFYVTLQKLSLHFTVMLIQVDLDTGFTAASVCASADCLRV